MSDLGAQEHMEGVRCPEVSTNGQLHTREASGAGLETISFGVPALVLKLLVLFDLLTGCFMPSNRCRRWKVMIFSASRLVSIANRIAHREAPAKVAYHADASQRFPTVAVTENIPRDDVHVFWLKGSNLFQSTGQQMAWTFSEPSSRGDTRPVKALKIDPSKRFCRMLDRWDVCIKFEVTEFVYEFVCFQ